MGSALGIIICQKVRKVPAPSMYAASSSSLGCPRKYCLKRKINSPFLNITQVALIMIITGQPVSFIPLPDFVSNSSGPIENIVSGLKLAKRSFMVSAMS